MNLTNLIEFEKELDTLLGERIIDHQPCPLPVDPLPTWPKLPMPGNPSTPIFPWWYQNPYRLEEQWTIPEPITCES